jgi:hypothetical protein
MVMKDALMTPHGRHRIASHNDFSVPAVARLNFVVHAERVTSSFTFRAMFLQPLFWIYGGRAAKRP